MYVFDIRLKQIQTNFSHTGWSPDFQRYYNSLYAGENIIRGFDTEEKIVSSWINSPEHLANIVNTHYTQSCVSTVTTESNTYSVQEFSSNF